MRLSGALLSLSVLPLVSILSGCEAESEADAATKISKPDEIEIECRFAYRESIFKKGFKRTTLNVTVPMGEEDLPLGKDETVKFDNIECTVSPQNGALLVHFVINGKPVTFTNYQFAGTNKTNPTTHGFTGLQYITPPGTDAELQFWAAIKSPQSSPKSK